MSSLERSSESAAIEAAAADWVVRRDAGLTGAEATELERWRAADPRHAAALAWHEQMWAALDRPQRAGKAGLMLAKVAASAARRRRRRLHAATGALALLLVAGFAWQLRHPPPAPAVTPPAAAGAFAVHRPETQTLPDGSVVELRRDARIRVDFAPALRRIALESGEAHFTVATDPQRPFVVTADTVEVRAVGTAFSVELAETEVDVLVTEGEVSVAAPVFARATADGAAAGAADRHRPNARAQVLTARQRVTVPLEPQMHRPEPAVVSVAESELTERLAWRSGRLEFTDTPLLEAVALMNRHSSSAHKLRFVIDDPELARAPVTGLFRADNAEAFVRLLEVSLGISAERSGDTVTLRKPR
jgi:transmembrane sensor